MRNQIMIRHIVMWKLKDEVDGKPKADLAMELKQQLEALPEKIDSIIELEVGINMNIPDSEAQADVVLTTTHAHREGLDAYRVHPDHQLVVTFALEIVKERRVVDYIVV